MTNPLYLQLRSGASFNLSGPVSPVQIADVAWALSHLCRFGGSSTAFYSVGQHSVLVSALVQAAGGDKRAQLVALLHDAHEMVLADIPSPVKWGMPQAVRDYYTEASNDVDERIRTGLGLHHLGGAAWDSAETVKRADLMALAIERRDVMVRTKEVWPHIPTPRDDVRITPWSPAVARARFLARWDGLVR